MRTIAIVLGDNDFGHTFYPLLEGLKAILMDRPKELDQESIRQIIRYGTMFYYIAYQHHFDGKKLDEVYLKHISEYLKGVQVLFDAEAEADITIKDHDGGAWYLEIQSGIIRGY